MIADAKEGLDEIGRRLLAALAEDARLSYAELGRRVGLSPPAVAERMRRLEETGLIRGYTVKIDRSRLGWPMTAFIRLKTPSENYARVDRLAAEWPEILECHHVTGDDSFIFKVQATSIRHLDEVIVRLAPLGPTTSSIVLSTRQDGKPPP